MSDLFVGVNGHRVTSVKLTVANVGPWVAELVFEGSPDLVGRVTLTIGTLELSGTLDPDRNGTFGLRRSARIVGGAGSWGSQVTAKNYANDAGIKARTVAEDAARAVGESLGSFVPTRERVGSFYVRQAGCASTALEDALGGAPWWVDYAGVTQAGPRPATALDATAYQVLAYDPATRVATLAVDDPGAIRIGSILTERLDAPQTVREFELSVTAEEMRVHAWCGGSDTGGGRLADLFRSIVERVTDGKLFGKYRYRVVRMNGDRVEAQAVRKAAGLPDLLPVSMWPGVAGVHAVLTPGAEVLVEFIEGDRTQPIVTHFAGKDGAGFVPTSLTLGGPNGSPAARQGDNVEVLLPPAIFSGSIGGTPATGVLTFPMTKTLGVITAGSSKVKVAT